MKRKIPFIAMILLVSMVALYAQTNPPIDPYAMSVISVTGSMYADKQQTVVYDTVYTLKNALWDGSTFTAHSPGLFLVTVSFVKDANYHNGTNDDVYLRVYKVDASGADKFMGYAWSGQGTGNRGTGAYTVVVELQEGEKITTIANAGASKPWHLMQVNLTIYSLPHFVN